MAHPEQQAFVQRVKEQFPWAFDNASVLEVGSLDINGSVRQFFDAKRYVGVDIGEGPGVDVVCKGHEYKDRKRFDCVISCECFEHNPHWVETFRNMVRLTRTGGLVVFSCATTGRSEHGTSRTCAWASPLTVAQGWDYYRNLTEQDFRNEFDIDVMFSSYAFEVNPASSDLYFWGIKP